MLIITAVYLIIGVEEFKPILPVHQYKCCKYLTRQELRQMEEPSQSRQGDLLSNAAAGDGPGVLEVE